MWKNEVQQAKAKVHEANTFTPSLLKCIETLTLAISENKSKMLTAINRGDIKYSFTEPPSDGSLVTMEEKGRESMHEHKRNRPIPEEEKLSTQLSLLLSAVFGLPISIHGRPGKFTIRIDLNK